MSKSRKPKSRTKPRRSAHPKADAAPTESSKFCPNCNSVVGGQAVYCEFCGARIIEPPPSAESGAPHGDEEFGGGVAASVRDLDDRPAQKLGKELVQRHIALARETRRKVEALLGETDAAERQIALLAEQPVRRERTVALQEVLEDLEVIGDRWEELQHEYNRLSEDLDDEFNDRFAEVDLDVTIPANLEQNVETQLRELLASFENLGERVRELGGRGNRLLEHAGGRWFASAPGDARGAVIATWVVPALIASTAAAAFLLWRNGVQSSVIASALAPTAAVILVAIIHRLIRR